MVSNKEIKEQILQNMRKEVNKMTTVEEVKKHILYYDKKIPVDSKNIGRAWSEGFVSGIYASKLITDEMFDELIIWIRKE